MKTTYTIEFMRLAEPPLTPIKHPSAFHVAYYCNPSATLRKHLPDAQSADFALLPEWSPLHCARDLTQ